MEKICITVEEAAKIASVSDEQIRDWAKDFDFPSMRIGARGGKRLIHADAFSDWLRKKCELRYGERRYEIHNPGNIAKQKGVETA